MPTGVMLTICVMLSIGVMLTMGVMATVGMIPTVGMPPTVGMIPTVRVRSRARPMRAHRGEVDRAIRVAVRGVVERHRDDRAIVVTVRRQLVVHRLVERWQHDDGAEPQHTRRDRETCSRSMRTDQAHAGLVSRSRISQWHDAHVTLRICALTPR